MKKISKLKSLLLKGNIEPNISHNTMYKSFEKFNPKIIAIFDWLKSLKKMYSVGVIIKVIDRLYTL